MIKKNITLDDVARMVQEGFAETASKKSVENLAISVENLTASVEERFEAVGRHFISLENRLDTLGQALLLLREDVQGIRKEAIQNEIDIRDLKNRVSRLEKKFGMS